MTELKMKQGIFSLNLSNLVRHIYDVLGCIVQQGEGWRPDWVAAEYAKQGKGIRNSLHGDRLAHDLIICNRDTGKEVGTDIYTKAGLAWKQMNQDNRWLGNKVLGGDADAINDMQHFSMTYQGRM